MNSEKKDFIFIILILCLKYIAHYCFVKKVITGEHWQELTSLHAMTTSIVMDFGFVQSD